MEASSIAIASGGSSAREFAAVGFTNLSQDHLDFHGDLETLLRGQGLALRRALPARGQRRRRLRRAARCRAPLRRSRPSPPTCAARRSSCVPTAPSCSCARRRARLSLEPRLRGRFNVDNVLCAVTLALLLDVPLGAIERAVAATGAPPGRFEPVEAGQAFGVIVDYAHTPGGIAAVLARRGRSPAGACCACSAPAATATTPSGR